MPRCLIFVIGIFGLSWHVRGQTSQRERVVQINHYGGQTNRIGEQTTQNEELTSRFGGQTNLYQSPNPYSGPPIPFGGQPNRLGKTNDHKGGNKYEQHTLLRIYPTNAEEIKMVSNFEDPMGEVEILKGSRGLNDSMDILVPPSRLAYVHELFVKNKSMTMNIRENYGRRFENMDRTPRRRVMGSRSFNVFEYHSYEQIVKYIDSVAKLHSDRVKVQYLGNSYQGRPISLVKISSNPTARNPIIFIDAGIHAREWVAPAMALYLIQRLANDPEARRHDLNGVDWYILPVVNPDGYEYTRTNRDNRMWRKTRSKQGFCFGVDGNRNYGFKWAVSGVSSNPCDKETYAGPEPFSEPETRLVRDALRENSKRIKLYVSMHSYGQYLVYPWGYTDSLLPKNWHKLDYLAKRVSDTVQRAGGMPFKVLSAGQWYPAAGGSDDYAFGAIGVPYSYTMELTDGHEFLFPDYLLKKVLPEFYAGFREFGSQIKQEFGSGRRRGHSGNLTHHANDITASIASLSTLTTVAKSLVGV